MAESTTKAKRTRNSNFSATERNLLLNIIKKYKSIIENKKTDAVTNEEKSKAWVQICNQFNAKSLHCRREIESLKKYYSNSKTKLRESIDGEEKEQLFKTSLKSKKNGLESEFDSDSVLFCNVKRNVNEILTPEISMNVQEASKLCSESLTLQNGENRNVQSIEEICNLNVKQESEIYEILEDENDLYVDRSDLVSCEPSDLFNQDQDPSRYVALLKKQDLIADLNLENLRRENLSRKMLFEWRKEEIDLKRKSLLLDIEIKKAQLKKIQDA